MMKRAFCLLLVFLLPLLALAEETTQYDLPLDIAGGGMSRILPTLRKTVMRMTASRSR